jgi:hypothetical protein
MAKDELTHGDSVRAAAAQAAAALGTSPEAVEQRVARPRRQPGNDRKTGVCATFESGTFGNDPIFSQRNCVKVEHACGRRQFAAMQRSSPPRKFKEN